MDGSRQGSGGVVPRGTQRITCSLLLFAASPNTPWYCCCTPRTEESESEPPSLIKSPGGVVGRGGVQHCSQMTDLNGGVMNANTTINAAKWCDEQKFNRFHATVLIIS